MLPASEPSLPDFRQLPKQAQKDLSPEARLELRLARERRAEFIALAGELTSAETLRTKWNYVGSASARTPVSSLTAHAKKILGVNWPPSQPFENGYSVFNFWREAFERAGILVFQCSVDPDEFRAAAIVETPFPVVLISSKDPVSARVFSLLHELGHVLLGESNLSLVWQSNRVTEIFCNRFAAEILMPEPILRADPTVVSMKGRAVEDGDLRKLSRRFGTSMYAMAVRLCDLQIQNRRILDAFKPQFSRETVRTGGGGDYYSNQVARLGPLLIQTTLRAVEGDSITPMDAYRILGVKPSYLENLRMAIGT